MVDKAWTGTMESEVGSDTSDLIRGSGVGWLRTVHGVWSFGCQEGVGSKPKDRECKGRRKKRE